MSEPVVDSEVPREEPKDPRQIVIESLSVNEHERIRATVGVDLTDPEVGKKVGVECETNGEVFFLHLIIPISVGGTRPVEVVVSLTPEINDKALLSLQEENEEAYYKLTDGAIWKLGEEIEGRGITGEIVPELPHASLFSVGVDPELIRREEQDFRCQQYELLSRLVKESSTGRVKLYVEETDYVQPDFDRVQTVQRSGEIVVEEGLAGALVITRLLDVEPETAESVFSPDDEMRRNSLESLENVEEQIQWGRDNADLLLKPFRREVWKTMPIRFHFKPDGTFEFDEDSLDTIAAHMKHPLVLAMVESGSKEEQKAQLKEAIKELTLDPFSYEYRRFDRYSPPLNRLLELDDLWGQKSVGPGIKRRIVVEEMSDGDFGEWNKGGEREDLLYLSY